MLRAVRNILHAELPEKWNNIVDAHIWRKLPFAVLLASLIVFGCFPKLLTDKISPSVSNIVQMANPVLAKAQTPATVETGAKNQSLLTSAATK
jgi:NADH:ubiquinone oxidoreductase subunit 4 (subunit M)